MVASATGDCYILGVRTDVLYCLCSALHLAGVDAGVVAVKTAAPRVWLVVDRGKTLVVVVGLVLCKGEGADMVAAADRFAVAETVSVVVVGEVCSFVFEVLDRSSSSN